MIYSMETIEYVKSLQSEATDLLQELFERKKGPIINDLICYNEGIIDVCQEIVTYIESKK
jgi:hypothetical protein